MRSSYSYTWKIIKDNIPWKTTTLDRLRCFHSWLLQMNKGRQDKNNSNIVVFEYTYIDTMHSHSDGYKNLTSWTYNPSNQKVSHNVMWTEECINVDTLLKTLQWSPWKIIWNKRLQVQSYGMCDKHGANINVLRELFGKEKSSWEEQRPINSTTRTVWNISWNMFNQINKKPLHFHSWDVVLQNTQWVSGNEGYSVSKMWNVIAFYNGYIGRLIEDHIVSIFCRVYKCLFTSAQGCGTEEVYTL